ncbi:MAG: TIGR04283 family arsenosugar biosynthesis glycosyltransferase [Planctomycetes bacterium]|nr:TIGR04283 family arsenosugar biosynthesis glycosyltransferase [Planctomycetota bacterium]MBL7037641.1 TIGR04283 family arsenosugar biosynthesis glycosyltransferase [Pirellulaceae bacterium]
MPGGNCVKTTLPGPLAPTTPALVVRPEHAAVRHPAERCVDFSGGSTISVVIPTLNEAAHLPRTLDSLCGGENIETIVVDGGSSDGTLGIAQREDCQVLRSPPSRAQQLNAGARSASGSILLFLHADTRLPPAFDSAVRTTLDEPGVVGGAFRLRIDAPSRSLRIIERAVDIRSRLFQMPYGDQAIFVNKKTFLELGGFPELPIMDDYEFIRRLRRRGKIRTASTAVLTSGRRWQQLGPWRTTWVNQKIILGYYLGIAPNRLAVWYHGALEEPQVHK